jgi:hypothetical protein
MFELLVKVAERLLVTPIPKEHEVVYNKEGQEVTVPGGEVTGLPGNAEVDPYKSVVAWCYVCRQGLGDEHDPSDPECEKQTEE